MKNIPEIKLGIVAGSRDWLPIDIAEEKRKALIENYRATFNADEIYECPVSITDNEVSVKRALRDVTKAECNALCVYYANYGPELTGAILAKEFCGPIMFVAAAEDGEGPYLRNRRDAYCGFIDACYGLNLQGVKAYIPSDPVGTLTQCSAMINEFIPIARTLIALQNLKIVAVGPRPSIFVGANAPTHMLNKIGVDVTENSELELFESFKKHEGDKRIEKLVSEMEQELGEKGNKTPQILSKLAQYEATIEDWIRNHRGNRKYAVMTSTCWPAFPTSFGFAPCYVHSRMTEKGIPMACEVDVYGAVSEYIGQCISNDVVTFLDINNNVPQSVFDKEIAGKSFNGKEYTIDDLFVGYHCGVTCSSKLMSCSMEPHFVNNQLLGEEYSRGTIQGEIIPGAITMFRLQGGIDGKMKAYVAQGQVLPVSMDTYWGYGIIAIPEMGRFYRNVLLEKHFPNHTAILFGHHGKSLLNLLKQLGIDKVEFNHPKSMPYKSENIYHSMKDWF